MRVRYYMKGIYFVEVVLIWDDRFVDNLYICVDVLLGFVCYWYVC